MFILSSQALAFEGTRNTKNIFFYHVTNMCDNFRTKLRLYKDLYMKWVIGRVAILNKTFYINQSALQIQKKF